MTFKKVFGLLLILIILAAGGVYLLMIEKADDDRMRSLYTEVEPLEREREALQEEKNSLETDYALKMRDYATVEVLFEHLDAQIIDEVWPVMRSRGVVGVLPISLIEVPGYYGKLSYDNLRTLMADGWGLCYVFDSPVSDAKTWVENLNRTLEMNQITPPTTIYFVNDNYYNPSMDEGLIAAGIRTVVRNASDGRSNTVTDFTAPLWFTGTMPFGYTGSTTDLELLGRTDGANLSMTLKLNIVTDQAKKKAVVAPEQLESIIEVLDSWKDLLYEDNPLDEMEQVGPTPNIYLNTNDDEVLHDLYLESLTDEQKLLLPKFRSLNFENALNMHLDMAAKVNDLGFERAKQEALLESQIKELDAQIAEVYARYEVGKKEIPQLTEFLKNDKTANG